MMSLTLALSWLFTAVVNPYARCGDTRLSHLSHALLLSTFFYCAYVQPQASAQLTAPADGLLSAAFLAILLLPVLLEARLCRRQGNNGASSDAEDKRSGGVGPTGESITQTM